MHEQAKTNRAKVALFIMS